MVTLIAPPGTQLTPADLGFQSHFWNPPPPSSEPESPTDSGPSLVPIPHNSATHPKKTCLITECPDARWVKGLCEEHRQVHWLLVPCKARECETCGPIGRYRIAQRIALGVRELWPAAWHVLTFTQDIEKKDAVRKLATYVKWLRSTPGNEGMQYVATYELTHKDRLHINLICAPWKHVPQATLQDKWGAIVWISWVKDDNRIGNEVAKNYSPESLSGYLSKLEQAVPTDRRVSYSKGWPKMPDKEKNPHKIRWSQVSFEEQLAAWHLLRSGALREVVPGEYRITPAYTESQDCSCFHLQIPFNLDHSAFSGEDPPV